MNPIEFLKNKRISLDLAGRLGVSIDTDTGQILYPRKSLDGSHHVGHKVRDLAASKQYNKPSGIPMSATRPFETALGGGALIVCEGETDALCLASHLSSLSIKDPRIIACPGATAFANIWAGLYNDHDQVYVIPDPDKAGMQLLAKVAGQIPRARHVDLEDMDLCDSIINKGMGYVNGRIADARYVQSTEPLKRTNYRFKPTADVEHSLLTDFVATDTTLRRRGKEYVGLCPLHDEKTPSFMVDPEKNLFFCQGCQKGGDVIQYLKLKHGLSYKEAVSKCKSVV